MEPAACLPVEMCVHQGSCAHILCGLLWAWVPVQMELGVTAGVQVAVWPVCLCNDTTRGSDGAHAEMGAAPPRE